MNELEIEFNKVKTFGRKYFSAIAIVGGKKYTWVRKLSGNVGEEDRLKGEAQKAFKKVQKQYERRYAIDTPEA